MSCADPHRAASTETQLRRPRKDLEGAVKTLNAALAKKDWDDEVGGDRREQRDRFVLVFIHVPYSPSNGHIGHRQPKGTIL